MRRRSGATRGQRFSAAIWLVARAHAFPERKRKTGFAVCRLPPRRGAKSSVRYPRTTSAGQSVVAARPDFGVLAGTLWLLPPYWHATEPRKHPPTHSSTHL